MIDLYDNFKDCLPGGLLSYKDDMIIGHGLIRLCNPNAYIDILKEGYNEKNAFPFAVTAFGDFLVWEKGKYVSLVSFSKNTVKVIESGFDFFFEDVNDISFLQKYFDFDLMVN